VPETRHLLSIRRETPAALLVVICLVLGIANSLVDTWIPRRLLVLFGVALLAYEAIGFRSMKYEQYFLFLLGLWIACAVTLTGAIHGAWWQESVYLPGNIGIALALCRGHLGRRTTGVLFYLVAAYFAYRLLTAASPAAIQHILVAGSANAISAFMVLFCGLHYAVTLAEGGRIRLLPAVVALLVSAMALGRSGMVAAALLLAGVALRDLLLERRPRAIAVKAVFYGSLALAVTAVVLPRLDAISFVFERFSEYGFGSEARDRIWGAYGESLDGPATLTGHQRGQAFAGYTNVHNSFIMWHTTMGVMAVPLYLLSLLALARAFLRERMLFLLLGVLLFRSAFDEVILPFRLYDFLYFYLVCTILVTLPSPRRQPAMSHPAEAEA
jgi:hypothetical protein